MIYPRSTQTPDDVGRHYDDLDTFYREIWGEHLHHGLWITGGESNEEAATNLVLHAVGRARLRRGVKVCDVGCGYGATARLLASHLGAAVTGLTISERQQQYANERHKGIGCRFLLRDWMSNDLPPETFDAVVAIESLSHMPDKARFFSEAARVLKPGGTLVVLAWLAGETVGRLQTRHLLEPICAEGRLPSMLSSEEVLALARQAGLYITDSDMLSRYIRRTWTICLRRLLYKIATDRRYQRYLLDATSSDRRFLLTLIRIIIAYRTGTMHYGLFVATRR